jgi:tRNA G18 (ribose-2'-O)-methylase SpoU
MGNKKIKTNHKKMKQQKLNIEDLNRISIDEFKKAKKIPLTVVLDNVRSLNNVGSIFRTSDAFCIEEVILCGITATPPNVEIHKTALGAENSVQWRYFAETLSAIHALKLGGYTVFSIEQAENSIYLENISLDKNKKYAIVLGHEVHGVQQTVIDASDHCIEIPQYGTKHSLNVSVTGGIVIWDFFRGLSREGLS